MVIVQRGGVGRTPTGGRYKSARAKRKFEMGRQPTHTRIGKMQLKHIRTKGKGAKARLTICDVANVYNPEQKKYVKATIKTVKENTASRHFVRRNIMTKGAIIETDLGLCRITSRPGQDGTINAILMK